MFGYLYLAVLSINLGCCVCYVNFNLFDEFKATTVTPKMWHRKKDYDIFFGAMDNANRWMVPAPLTRLKGPVPPTRLTVPAPVTLLPIPGPVGRSTAPTPVTRSKVPSPVTRSTASTPITRSAAFYPVTRVTAPTPVTIRRREINFTTANDFYLTTTEAVEKKTTINANEFKMKCPETEKPLNIGTYEIPTQRDLALFMQKKLQKMFDSYHEKTLLLLKDIKDATRATVAVERKCHGRGRGLMYKQCVKQVNRKFVSVTKGLVKTLESEEAQVIALTEGKICNLASMKTNPIQLIKILAMDDAALDFALPAFLRLLGGCAIHCNKPAVPDHRPRLRQMRDQELVVKHFLTNKDYFQLLKDKTYV